MINGIDAGELGLAVASPALVSSRVGPAAVEGRESAGSLDKWLDILDQRVGPSPSSPRPSSQAAQVAPRPRSRSGPGTCPRDASGESSPSWACRLRSVLLDSSTSNRIEALFRDLETPDSADPFSLSTELIDGVFPLAYALHRYYFRVRSEGHDRIPNSGPVVLAANHGGLLPFDGVMTITDVLLRQEEPRLLRAILDRWVDDLPFVRDFMARTGQVIGTHENFDALLERGEAVLVFPEGVDGIRKTIDQRYRLQPFHPGFVGKAIGAGAPIVPVAIIGSDDQAPILYDVRILARLLGLPAFPITPTFPWLGPVGLLPYPVSYRIVYGEPFRFHENLAPQSAGSRAEWAAMASRVRCAIQGLVDRHRVSGVATSRGAASTARWSAGTGT